MMNECEICQEGHLEMCEWYRKNYMEKGGPVHGCPKFLPDPEQVMDVVRNARGGQVRILNSRSIRKAEEGERVMLLTKYRTALAEQLLRVLEDTGKELEVASVCVALRSGGEIWIGGMQG